MNKINLKQLIILDIEEAIKNLYSYTKKELADHLEKNKVGVNHL